MTDVKGCETREGKESEEENGDEKETDLEEEAVLLQTSTPERSSVCDQDDFKDHKDQNVGDNGMDKGGRAWKMSQCMDGHLMYMYVK